MNKRILITLTLGLLAIESTYCMQPGDQTTSSTGKAAAAAPESWGSWLKRGLTSAGTAAYKLGAAAAPKLQSAAAVVKDTTIVVAGVAKEKAVVAAGAIASATTTVRDGVSGFMTQLNRGLQSGADVTLRAQLDKDNNPAEFAQFIAAYPSPESKITYVRNVLQFLLGKLVAPEEAGARPGAKFDLTDYSAMALDERGIRAGELINLLERNVPEVYTALNLATEIIPQLKQRLEVLNVYLNHFRPEWARAAAEKAEKDAQILRDAIAQEQERLATLEAEAQKWQGIVAQTDKK